MKNKILLFLLIFFLISGLRAGENQAVAQDREEAKPVPKVGRAFIETGIQIVVSAVNYWNKYSKFIEDWQFSLTWKDQKRKFFTSEGLRLDSNNMRLNWTHAWSGALYYNWARTNRLSPFTSFLFSAGGSLFWEYIAEWREISSINDHVFTWAGGPAIGEPLFQIGDHFRNRPGIANRIVGLLINWPMAVNDLLDGKNRPSRIPKKDWSDFRFSFGDKRGPVSPASETSSQTALGIEMRLVTLPGYGQAGESSGYSRTPIDNEYNIFFNFSSRGVEEFALHTRTVLSGWWWKNVRTDKRGFLRGAEYWLGLVSAWDFFQKKPLVPYDGNDLGQTNQWFEREQPTRFTDKFSSIHIIGPAFNMTRYSGRLTARFDLEATFDFSMINALAYNRYSADHDVWGVKTTLHNWGYYYAMGYTVNGRLDLSYGLCRVQSGIEYQHFSSIQGLDRYQGLVTDDTGLVDSRLITNAALQLRLPRSPLFFSLNVEAIKRWGRFHEVNVSNHEARFFYQLGVSF